MTLIKKYFKKYREMPISARAAVWFMICSVIQKVLIMATTPIFTRMLTTTEYGQYTVYISWLQIFTIVTTLRLDYSVFNKGMSKFGDDKPGYTLTMQTTTSLITLLCFFIYVPFHGYVDRFLEMPFVIVVLIFIECFFTPAMNFWLVEQRYDFQYKRVVTVTLLLACLNILAGLIFVSLSQEKGYARILSCIVSQIVISAAIYGRNIIRGKRIFNKVYAKFALTFNVPLIPHYVSIYILDQSDRVMIQKLCSIAEAGLYGVAASIGGILKIVTTALNTTLIPTFYRKLEKNDVAPIRKIVMSISYVLIGLLLMMEMIAPEVMVIFAGEKYRTASYVIAPMAVSVFLTFLYQLIANIEFYYNANKFTMVISVSGAILNMLLNYIFIKMFGFVAAAYTTVFCYTLFLIGHYYYMKHITRKNGIPDIFRDRDIWMLIGILIVPTVIISLLYGLAVIRYILFAGIMFIAFLKRKKLIQIFQNIMRR